MYIPAGLVVAVLGKACEGGKFDVEETCFAGLPDPDPREGPSEDRYLSTLHTD